mgnify:CR=1 FL=1
MTVSHDRALGLLAQTIVSQCNFAFGLVGIDLDIIIVNAVRRQDSYHAIRGQPTTFDDFLQQRLRLLASRHQSARDQQLIDTLF